MGNMGRDWHDEQFLQHALSNAATTFYTGRNDRGSLALVRCLERFMQGTLRGLGRNVARGWTMTNVCVKIARFRNVNGDTRTVSEKRSCELNYSNFRFLDLTN